MRLSEFNFTPALSLAESVKKRGGADAPLKALESVVLLTEAGGDISKEEARIVLNALRATMSSDMLDEVEHERLDVLISELTPKLDSISESSQIQISGTFLVEDGSEPDGLSWPVRIISSGITVDKRQDYTEAAIEGMANLVEGVQCFADHAAPGAVPSVDKVVGWFTSPTVVRDSDGSSAVHATLNVLETSRYSGLLRESYNRGKLDIIGLSINGAGRVRPENRQGVPIRVVESVDRLISVDLVTKPNAGGKLLALQAAVLDAAEEIVIEEKMPNSEVLETNVEVSAAPVAEAALEVETNVPATDAVQAAQDINALRSDLERLQADIAAERLRLGKERLVASYNLPANIYEMVRADVDSAATTEAADTILKNAKSIWAAAIEFGAANSTVLRQVGDNPDLNIRRLQNLIAGRRVNDVAPFANLREAFSTISGLNTNSMVPQEYATNLIRASQGFDSFLSEQVKTTDWSYSLGQAIYREMIREYSLPGFDDWRKIVSNISSINDMRQRDRVRVGYYDVLPTVDEAGTYQPLTDPTEVRAYFTPVKRGGLADYTWESALNDDLQALRSVPKKLAMSAKVTLWYNILNIIAAATPPTCSYDSVALFHATHSNLGSTTLTAATWLACRKAMMTQTPSGNTYMKMGVLPTMLIVPPDLEGKARQLRDSDVDIDTTTFNLANPWKGSFDIMVIPFWTDADAWAAIADPNMIPTIEVAFLGGREEPELFTEAVNTGSHFTADSITYKIRHVWQYCVLDHRGMYKAVP